MSEQNNINHDKKAYAHNIDLKALGDLALIDHTTIKTDLTSYIMNVFKLIDSLFEVDTSHITLKHNTVSLTNCRADVETEYDHPVTRPIKVDRIVKK